ncbi:ADP-ribosylglycohydrolase [Lachnospiraceae bacterium JC7]|nr:ADP-ribosylglycohydrolase [Lachnospiraceae bacterium JC7]
MIRMDKKDIVKAGIWGVVIGDALGVPVEFMSRAELKADSVVGMREYTPHGKVFDIGITCARAKDRYRPGMDPLSCGESDEYSNGNGSLMRIMPVSLNNCTETEFWCDSYIEDAALDAHNISKLTHAHPRSQMACLFEAYGRLNDLQAFKNLPEDEIKSSGYVVHTLEAAILCRKANIYGIQTQ